jgi:hypothetical protein
VIKVNVRFDKAAFQRDLNKLRKDVVPKVMARSINRAADGVKAETVRTLSKLTSIKQAEIRSRMFMSPATPHKLWAEVGVLPYAPNLRKFKATQNKKGVAATAWGQRVTYKGAFKLPTGGVVSRPDGVRRGRMKGLYGPSLPRTFMRPAVIRRLEAIAKQRWRSEFEREMARRLRSAI